MKGMSENKKVTSVTRYHFYGITQSKHLEYFCVSSETMPTTLAHIKPGNRVRIEGITNDPIKPKLLEMGLITGTCLDVLFVAPFGDPMAIDVKGYVLSLRMDEAELINVVPVNSQE